MNTDQRGRYPPLLLNDGIPFTHPPTPFSLSLFFFISQCDLQGLEDGLIQN